MKPPTLAPAYAALFPPLAEIAQQHGYALAIHGSLVCDMDLIAVPWTDEALPADKLIKGIVNHINYFLEEPIEHERLFSSQFCEMKPHGRMAWAIPLGAGAVIDISVTSLLKEPKKLNAEMLAVHIRKLIDDKTLQAGLDEIVACEVATDALDLVAEGFEMRLGELNRAEEEE